MIILIYAAIAIVFLILVLGLLREPQPVVSDEGFSEKSYAPNIGNGRWLDLSERIFDPSDARWLQEELAFPKLAKALTIGRKRLAIRWLESLQASFDDLIRTPELATSDAPETIAAGGWQMLWLTLRFKLLISYALMVVRLFGPYRRLVPSFSWVPLSRGSQPRFQRAAIAAGRASH